MTIYSGPGRDYPAAGILEAGATAGGKEHTEGEWLNIVCPHGITGSCWVLWNMNVLHSYEGPPITLNIPDPASLNIEHTNTSTSPNGLWQVEVTQSETVSLGGEEAWFFYVELTVTSLETGTTWTPLSEWHASGIGQEHAPIPFYWSQDGRYLYYTSLFDLHGACVSMNIGERLDRLDLTDGTVAAIKPPYAFRLLSISPDETMMAYIGGQSIVNFTGHGVLIVRELDTAYTEGDTGQDSILWKIPLDIAWPTAVSELAWSPDSRKILVTSTTLSDDLGNLASITTWELDKVSPKKRGGWGCTPPPTPFFRANSFPG